jgi:hypothetical protein
MERIFNMCFYVPHEEHPFDCYILLLKKDSLQVHVLIIREDILLELGD